MAGDWFRMYRKLKGSPVFGDEGLLKMWIWCLIEASWQERVVMVKTGRGRTPVTLRPGQFIFGRFAAGEDLKLSPTTAAYRLNTLKKLGNVVTQPGRHYTLVTICNWETYQEEDSEGCHQPCQRIDTQLSPNCHPTGTHKERQERQEVQEQAAAPLTVELLSAKWNAIPGVTSCRKPGDNRRKAFKTRAADPAWVVQVDAALEKIARSAFLHGGGRQGWRADLDWFLKPDSLSKIMEGKYDDNGQPGRRGEDDGPATF